MTRNIPMEQTKMLTNGAKLLEPLSKLAARHREEAHEIVRDLVRMQGSKQAAAFEAVARDTGLTPRRVRSHYLGEPITVAAHEREAIQRALIRAYTLEEKRAAHRASMWRQRLGYDDFGMALDHGAHSLCGAPSAA